MPSLVDDSRHDAESPNESPAGLKISAAGLSGLSSSSIQTVAYERSDNDGLDKIDKKIDAIRSELDKVGDICISIKRSLDAPLGSISSYPSSSKSPTAARLPVGNLSRLTSFSDNGSDQSYRITSPTSRRNRGPFLTRKSILRRVGSPFCKKNANSSGLDFFRPRIQSDEILSQVSRNRLASDDRSGDAHSSTKRSSSGEDRSGKNSTDSRTPQASTQANGQLAAASLGPAPTAASLTQPSYYREMSTSARDLMRTTTGHESPDRVWTKSRVEQEYQQINLQRKASFTSYIRSCLGWNRKDWERTLRSLNKQRLRLETIQRLVKSQVFMAVIMLAIFANAVFVACQTHMSMEKALDVYDSNGMDQLKQPLAFKVIDILFCIFFALELILRLLAEEFSFIFGKDRRWNMFDLFVVLASIPEAVLTVHGNDGNSSIAAQTRFLRIVRVFRAVRIVRLFRFSPELRVIMLSILNSLVPMLWAFIFLTMAVYLFTVLFLQGLTSHIEDEAILSRGSSYEEPRTVQEIKTYFNSFPMTFLSLFMAVTNGVDWWRFAETLIDTSIFYGVLFVIYIVVMMIGILNIITGVFVETTKSVTREDRDNKAEEAIEQSMKLGVELRRLFEEGLAVSGENQDLTIGWDAFENFVHQGDVSAYFHTIGIDTSEAATLFKILDVDDSGAIEIDEFVIGCMRMKAGTASSTMATLLYEQRQLGTKLCGILEILSTMEDRYRTKAGLMSPSSWPPY